MPKFSLMDNISAHTTLAEDGRCWAVADLKHAVSAWRSRLNQLDAQVVAFDLPNGLEWVALNVTLLETGRVAVPIPSFFSDKQRTHALEDSGATLLVEAAGREKTDQFRGACLTALAPIDTVSLPPGTVLVTYTSGSTGAPRGACLSAETLLVTARCLVENLSGVGIERHLCILPLTLLLENVAGLYANLINGSHIAVPSLSSLGIRGSSEVDMPTLVASITRWAPDSLICVPALLLGLTTCAELGLVSFEHLKFVAVGGGLVTGGLLVRAERQKIPVFEGYGLTECGSVVALNTPTVKRRGTVGKLLPHVSATVIDGELVVSEPRMLGYVASREMTSCAIHTEDLVDVDNDGFLIVHGRIKNIFITAYGRNICPEWIESELQTELAIGMALVCGDAESANTALLVPRGEPGNAELEAAVNRCNDRLPDYARIGQWHQVSTDMLQTAGGMTGNGRMKRDVAMQVLTTLRQQAMPKIANEEPLI